MSVFLHEYGYIAVSIIAVIGSFMIFYWLSTMYKPTEVGLMSALTGVPAQDIVDAEYAVAKYYKTGTLDWLEVRHVKRP